MAHDVEPVALHETTRERYLNYALSVITSRALPDVRDGLKPVQRRILYGMQQLRLAPDSRFRKSAQVVGEVMGKYHPHGDTAIYDAMVRMAQTFSLRYTLVDGHGNFGSLDGDGAAAMRYTEARMSHVATQLLNDLSDLIVPYRPTYDASNTEPVVLPAAFPNLLVNGATGIAVGMATNIPPHNLKEVLNGCVAMVENPDIDLDGLLKHIPAPDFPTGGRILNSPEELRNIYATGRGPVELRGEFVVEKEGRRKQVVITSVPYTANKATIVEKIADHIRTGRLPLAVDVRDESTDIVRVVVDLKGGADPEAVMAYLFKHTPLQTRFHVNLTCLVPTENPHVGRPERLGLKPVLRYFLDFRFEVITRRLEMELARLRARIHILEGFEALFDALDEAIQLIRESRDKADAAERLMARFSLDEEQTSAVLEMRLYRLAQLEMDKIRAELEAKRSEAARIEALLADDGARWGLVRDELIDVRKRFGDPRLTTIGGRDLTETFDKEVYIIKENVYVIVTRQGWLKRQKSYNKLESIRVRDGDEVGWVMLSSTRASLVVFSNRGKAYTLRVADVPMTTGYGEPVQAIFDFADGERIVGAAVTDVRSLPEVETPPEVQTALPFAVDEAGDTPAPVVEAPAPHPLAPYLVVALSRKGQSIRIGLEMYEAPSTRNGRLYMRLQSDDPSVDNVVRTVISGGGEFLCVASRESRAMTFPVEEISTLKSAGKGVRAIGLGSKDFVVGFTLTRVQREGLKVFTNRGREVNVSPRRYPPVTRGARGRLIVRRGYIETVEVPCIERRMDAEELESEELEAERAERTEGIENSLETQGEALEASVDDAVLLELRQAGANDADEAVSPGDLFELVDEEPDADSVEGSGDTDENGDSDD